MSSQKDLEKARQVIANCLGCNSQDLENCESFKSGLIDDCVAAFVPTDEELLLLAGAGEEAIERLKERVRKQANEWRRD